MRPPVRQSGFRSIRIRAASRRGEPFEAIVGFDETLDAMTLEDISAAAQRYFTEDRYVRVVLAREEE